MLSVVEYLIGAGALAATAAALALASVRLRRALLPGWTGPPARLAETVLALSILTILLQLLGTVGLLDRLPLVIGTILIAVLVGRPKGASPGSPPPPPAPTTGPWLTATALALATVVAVHWATGVQDAWAKGMQGFDTLWYHAPFAARFAQEGSITALHFTDPEYLNWFYPQNSELLHAAGIVLFERDLLSPLLNLAWLGIALLAAWCIGRPYGVAPLAMVAVAIVLDTGMTVPRSPGQAANDIGPTAMLLASAAILLNALPARRSDPASRPKEGSPASRLPAAALVVGGLATGLAVGTKLTLGAPAAALTVAIAKLSPAGERLRSTAIWLGCGALTGGFWFVRNIASSGNPLPWIRDIGPLSLPSPERGLEGRDPFSVAHYLFDTSTALETSFFRRSLEDVIGPAWWLILLLAAAGIALALWRGAPIVRALGFAALAAGIGYLFTPLTASGPEGEPLGFPINLRYAVPALTLGIALLPLDGLLSGAQGRGWLTPARRGWLALAALAALLATTTLGSDSNAAWEADAAYVPGAIAIGFAVLGAPVAVALLARASALAAAALAAALLTAVGLVGYLQQDDYLNGRYAQPVRDRIAGFSLATAQRWVAGTSGLRIAVAGTSGGYYQYVFYGRELDNRVQYVGDRGPNGDFEAIGDCERWREALNDGDYDFLIATPELDLNHPLDIEDAPETAWTRGDPAATAIRERNRVTVFRLDGDLDPAACDRARPPTETSAAAAKPGARKR